MLRVHACTAIAAIGLMLAGATGLAAQTPPANTTNPNAAKKADARKPPAPPPPKKAKPATPPKAVIEPKDKAEPKASLSKSSIDASNSTPRSNPPVNVRTVAPVSSPPANTGAHTDVGINRTSPSPASVNFSRPAISHAHYSAPVAVHPANNGILGKPAPLGSHPQMLKNGSAIQRRANGQVSDVHDVKRRMDIHNTLSGLRRVTLARPDGSRIVSQGRAGFVEKPFTASGQQFAQRTYSIKGRISQTFYRAATYQGVPIHVYTPSNYFPTSLYGWVFHSPTTVAAGGGLLASVSMWLTNYVTCTNPLGMGQQIQAGINQLGMGQNSATTAGNSQNGQTQNSPGQTVNQGEPSQDPSGQNYANGQGTGAAAQSGSPCPQSQGAAAQAGYQVAQTQDPSSQGGQGQSAMGQDTSTQTAQGMVAPGQSQPDPNAPPVLTPDVQQQVSNEIKNQISLESSEAAQNARGQLPDPGSSGIARMLGDGQAHIFVVDNAIDVVDASGAECALNSGDVLQVAAPPAPSDTTASLQVLASNGGKQCAVSDSVAVSFDDLQEMQNHMRQMIDQGLNAVQQNQGQPGIPVEPQADAGATPAPAAFTPLAPPPDPNATNEVNQTAQQGSQSVTNVASQAQQEASSNPAPTPSQ